MALTLKTSDAFTQLAAMNGPQWWALAGQHGPKLVAALAVMGIAWQAARLTWLLLTPIPMPVTVAPASNVPVGRAVDAQQIANAHLFGVAGAAEATDPNALPQTQMSLVLAGTMALDDPQAGFAIIGDNAANAKFYRVGAVINGGARLHSVYVDRVIIERNGALETLVLPRGIPSSAPAPVARNVVVPNAVENLRRIARNNPSALGELLRAQPVFNNGTQKGYRIYPGRDRQQFTRLGLMAGDLVVSINGSSLDDPARGNEILNTLVASSSAQLVIERNGSMQTLNLDMAQVSLPELPGVDNPGGGSADAGVPSLAAPPRSLRSLRDGPAPVETPPASAE